MKNSYFPCNKLKTRFSLKENSDSILEQELLKYPHKNYIIMILCHSCYQDLSNDTYSHLYFYYYILHLKLNMAGKYLLWVFIFSLYIVCHSRDQNEYNDTLLPQIHRKSIFIAIQ